ncbi:MAG: cytidine deaminase [Myxococcales bacterium]
MASPGDLRRLLRAASRARESAYAPYSRYPVGAAVLANGRIYAACNVENGSFPLSVCAERNAVGMAVASGARRIDAVAVVGGTSRPASPCGGCRQVLAEFCDASVPVQYAIPGGPPVSTTMGALLPDAFSGRDVKEVAAPSTDTPASGRRAQRPGSGRTAPRRPSSRSSGR